MNRRRLSAAGAKSGIVRIDIANAFRFELTRVQTPAVRERVLSLLANVDAQLVARVAEGLGMEVPAPQPRATDAPVPDYAPSPALSLLARPGQTGVRTRRVAILVAPGVDAGQVGELYAGLLADGAVPRVVGAMLGKVKPVKGKALDVEISLEAGPSISSVSSTATASQSSPWAQVPAC